MNTANKNIETHSLGFSRIGEKRELKKSIEHYWRGEQSDQQLEETAKAIRQANWKVAKQAGLSMGTVGDFSFYDQTLDFSHLISAIPKRFAPFKKDRLKVMFVMARGEAKQNINACAMTKWYNTNYHYIIPELDEVDQFKVSKDVLATLLGYCQEAKEYFSTLKVVLPGPLSYLRMAKYYNGENSLQRKISLLPSLLDCYQEIFSSLASMGVAWVQMDEGILSGDFSDAEEKLLLEAYSTLNQNKNGLKLMVASYFGCHKKTLDVVEKLEVDGVHLDYVEKDFDDAVFLERLPRFKHSLISLGIISGRNIWRTALLERTTNLAPIAQALGTRLALSFSCSLMHVPISLKNETEMAADLRSWLAFGKEKLEELQVVRRLLESLLKGVRDEKAEKLALEANQAALDRRTNKKINRSEVKARLAGVSEKDFQRKSPVAQRLVAQQTAHPLPKFPTTTIGSFPQTKEIRKARADFRKGTIDQNTYDKFIENEIANAIKIQEEIGIDLFVHGEAERNDMVEYFADKLEGYAFTKLGWVQSYGTRCVKPPIIFGDVQRKAPMTVHWSTYANEASPKPIKGMLTGPLTMLGWSFVRDDQPHEATARQIALALRDEVKDLEAAGIFHIQVDEPAIREGMPLRRALWDGYLRWAVDCFKLTTAGVADTTQIHTHMCYSSFQDILPHIARMDADVISIESSKSKMELLSAFHDFKYPAQIGPGVYDVHSSRVPTQQEIKELLTKALAVVSAEKLWVNPDCGLKTRGWKETRESLINMVKATRSLREESDKGLKT